MSDREHTRVPVSLRVEFRTASSLLITYSVNLSRGGLFLETDEDLALGTALQLALAVPGEPAVPAHGVIAWRRGRESPDGPPGLGVEFADVGDELGQTIDRLIARYRGVRILLVAADRQERMAVAQKLRSTLTTVEVVQADDDASVRAALSPALDLVVVALDTEAEAGLWAIGAASALVPPVPTVAIAGNHDLAARARRAGAAEVVTSPPAFEELQLVVVRALGRPSSIAARSD